MEMNKFIADFAAQWDDTDAAEFTPNCEFHELEEWSSLVGLAILNMIVKKYNVRVTPLELRQCVTIQDLYDTVKSKL